MTRALRGHGSDPSGVGSSLLGLLTVLLLVLLAGGLSLGARTDDARAVLGWGPVLSRTGRAVAPARVTPLPTQPAALAYVSTKGVRAYAEPGGMVVTGQGNYGAAAFRRLSHAGGHVLVYLDPVVVSLHGAYQRALYRASACGPAVPHWPGVRRVDAHRQLADFRVGGVLQSKLTCVLERIVADNPHIAGFFADDVGSRSWFPGLAWGAFGERNRRAYRAGAIALTRTFRRVADRHGLIFLVNGTWGGGSLRRIGGGYPNASVSGNALADGGTVEHHDGQLGYFGPYACSAQWAARSPITHGRAVNFAITRTAIGTTEYAHSNCFAWVAQQRSYSRAPKPWWVFHRIGLPTRVRH